MAYVTVILTTNQWTKFASSKIWYVQFDSFQDSGIKLTLLLITKSTFLEVVITQPHKANVRETQMTSA